MYHQIVKGNLLRSFEAINQRNYDVITQQFADKDVEHYFSGTDHPLAGTRRNLPEIKAWYERLERLMPDLHFDIKNVAISGWPWDTTAMLEWTDTLTDRNGASYGNHGVHVIQIRWGKVHRLAVFCDTEYLQGYFAALASQGVDEASADLIGTQE